ncbi:hypothetical protein BDN70DRAFT_893453 [Pholiota conissans]|uniref:ZZ-type domain-containing protein n=1 Tax=Pholiota conissans TaxID=109636 RepID=A0A9P5Z645_9AGAR|nr:hypothetical protein BDN70DRAFT_893453 [Pholiota conissans]
MSNLQFHCDSCKVTIPSSNPRVHCLGCADYDLCSNCYLGERFTQGHQVGHQTSVFKLSGGAGQQPVPASINYSASPPVQSMPAPHSPPPTGYHPNTQGPPPQYLSTSSPYETGLTLPPAPNAPTGWQPFFHPDGCPTPLFVEVINVIFTYLDPHRTGNLVPETFSRLLDDMGYLAHENAWRNGLQASFNASKESMADQTLKKAFDLFSINHILLRRAPAPKSSSSGLSSFKRALRNALAPSGSSMPCITRNGLLEVSRIGLLGDPSKGWGNFSRMLRKYNLPQYRGWGDLPRSVLPDMPDAAMLQRIAGVEAFMQRKANEQLDALQMSVLMLALIR